MMCRQRYRSQENARNYKEECFEHMEVSNEMPAFPLSVWRGWGEGRRICRNFDPHPEQQRCCCSDLSQRERWDYGSGIALRSSEAPTSGACHVACPGTRCNAGAVAVLSDRIKP